jgi:hypothetical protein
MAVRRRRSHNTLARHQGGHAHHTESDDEERLVEQRSRQESADCRSAEDHGQFVPNRCRNYKRRYRSAVAIEPRHGAASAAFPASVSRLP